MRASFVVIAALAAVTLSGCDETPAPVSEGGDKTSAGASASVTSEQSPAAAQSDLPRCADVWVAGKVLPARYAGCVQAGQPASDQEKVVCESGQVLHRHGARFYAVERGKVIRTEARMAEDAMFRRAYASCTA